MSDETQTVETTEAPKGFTQEEVDRIIAQRLTREREKYGDYDEYKKKAETLEAKEKERQDAELTEVDKLKVQLQEKDDSIVELGKHKQWREDWDKMETEKIDDAMKDFADDDKELVNSMPLERRMTMIDKLSSPKDKPSPQTGKMFVEGKYVPTLEEARNMRHQYGPESIQYKDALKLRKRAGILGSKKLVDIDFTGKENL